MTKAEAQKRIDEIDRMIAVRHDEALRLERARLERFIDGTLIGKPAAVMDILAVPVAPRTIC